jgi:hypothetical protein
MTEIYAGSLPDDLRSSFSSAHYFSYATHISFSKGGLGCISLCSCEKSVDRRLRYEINRQFLSF